MIPLCSIIIKIPNNALQTTTTSQYLRETEYSYINTNKIIIMDYGDWLWFNVENKYWNE